MAKHRPDWPKSCTFEAIAETHSRNWGVTIDAYQCFACGRYRNTHTLQWGSQDHAAFEAAWAAIIMMERAHVVAHCEGGKMEIANTVILCWHCHKYQERRPEHETWAWAKRCATERKLHLPWALPTARKSKRSNYVAHLNRQIANGGHWNG